MRNKKNKIYNSPRNIPRIDSVLNSLSSTNTKLVKLKVIVRVLKAWRSAVGEKLSKITEVIKFENEILYIKVKSSVWRNEFFHIENEIKEKLKKDLRNIKIKKIIFF
ncbi:MAG: DUF721 domain-containing protein [Candidatus Delongbacteria bacterium]